MEQTLFTESLIIILASAAVIAFCVRVGFSPIIGYLVTGLAIGPYGLGLLTVTEGTRFLAELGVVLLMFMVGLEFSFSRMLAARRLIFGMGGAQVLLTASLVAGGALLLGVAWPAALILGGAVAMSSTAITLKQLADQEELNSAHGRLAVAVLLFQDLATLPFLVFIDVYGSADTTGSAAVLLQKIGLATLGILLIAFLARRALHGLLSWIARLHSTELFLLTVLAMALGMGYLAHWFGLSPPIGAFLAGMMIGESDFRHQVEDDLRPFRDVLLGLFFLTIGTQIDLSVALDHPGTVAAALLLFLLLKAVVILALTGFTAWRGHTGLRSAIILAHGSEFGLLILSLAMQQGDLLPAALAQPVLLGLVLSLAIAPVLIQYNERLARRLWPAGMDAGTEAERDGAADVDEASRHLNDHVILCGCGRVGRLVASVLETCQVPYVAIESQYGQVDLARRQGHHVVFGDASRARLLDAAGLRRASAVVITFDRPGPVRKMLDHIRHVNPAIHVVVSTDDDRERERFLAAGANAVLPENLAAGLSLGAHVLVALGMEHAEVARHIDALRAELQAEP